MSIKNLAASDNQITFKKELDLLIQEAQKLASDGIIANLKGMKIRTDRKEVLKKLTTYKIMISGVDDPLIPLNHAQLIAKSSKYPLISISGGHLSHIENYSSVREILHFID